MAELVITDENFEQEVLQAKIPVMVDFWASWCGPCRMLAPIIEELAQELDGRAKVCKCNVDDYPSIASRFGIMSIPTVLVFKNGELAASSVGVRSKADLAQMIE